MNNLGGLFLHNGSEGQRGNCITRSELHRTDSKLEGGRDLFCFSFFSPRDFLLGIILSPKSALCCFS